MRKNNRILGTRELLRLKGIRNGVIAFLGAMIVGIVLMWLSIVSLFGVGVVLVIGLVLFGLISRKDIIEQRKLNKESGIRRI